MMIGKPNKVLCKHVFRLNFMQLPDSQPLFVEDGGWGKGHHNLKRNIPTWIVMLRINGNITL